MRINRWILSLVLFVIFHSLRANDFAAIEKVIQIKGFIDDEIGGILQADDGNYYMILNIVSTVVQIDSLNFDSNEWANRYPDMCIVRFNSELEVDTMFMIEENVYGYTIEIYDGTIRVGGRYFFSDDPRIFYGHYTLDGEKIWSKSIYTDFNLFSRYDWEDRSTYFVASSLYDWIHEDIIYKQENGYRTSVFGKVSEDGQLLWTNALYGNGKKTFQGQWARNNGSYLLSYAYKCDTLRFNQTEIVSNAVDGMDKKIFIKFDKTGKVTGHTEMYGKDLYNGLMRLIDDKIYTRVYFEEKMYWGHDSIVAPEGEYHSRYFVRLNIDGSIESKLFCELSFDNLSQLPDGNFVGTFKVETDRDYRYGDRVFSTDTNKRQQYLVKIDPSGNILKDVLIGEGFSGRLDFSVDKENKRVHIFVDERLPINFTWQGEKKQEYFYYCSYDYDLNEVDYLKLGDSFNYIYSGTFNVRNNGENELLGHFRMVGTDSVSFGENVYYNTKRWEDSSYYEDFLFTMSISSNKENELVVTKPDLVSLKAFPNPFQDVLTLDIVDKAGDLIIYSLSGEVVYRDRISGTQTIDLQHLNKGIYILVLKTEGQNYLQKLEKR